MSSPVTYRLDDSVATITMDDGKVNVLSLEMFEALNDALDCAAEDEAAVVLTGRQGAFSGGFDLRTLMRAARARTSSSGRLRARGAAAGVSEAGRARVHRARDRHGRLPAPSGGLSSRRGGATRSANEVAIGITMPFFGVEICRQRLAPAHFHRAVTNSEVYAPDDAVTAGFLDRIVPAADLAAAARATAAALDAESPHPRRDQAARARAGAARGARGHRGRRRRVPRAALMRATLRAGLPLALSGRRAAPRAARARRATASRR